MRVKCFAQEHNTMTWPGLEPGPLDPESTHSGNYDMQIEMNKKTLPWIPNLDMSTRAVKFSSGSFASLPHHS